jgi:hypothetical protein
VNAAAIVERLAAGPTLIRAVAAGASAEECRWKPPSGAWSIIEIICHLVDEEMEDFRARLQLTLRDPAADWPGINPVAWSTARGYQDRELAPMLEKFEGERKGSVAWLRRLGEPDWSTARRHPKFGPIHAGDLLAAWAAHDLLHARQIVKRRYEWIERLGEPFSTGYAGEWGA